MLFRICILLIFLLRPAFAQLELGEAALPSGEEPTPTATPVAVDEEAVQSLARQIQIGTSRQSPKAAGSEHHPGQAYYERVHVRLTSSPAYVRVTAQLQNGTTVSGLSRNQLVEVETALGPLPVQLSEIRRIKTLNGVHHLKLKGEDQLSGVLSLKNLVMEREDTSTVIIPVDQILSLQVLNPST